MQDAVGHVNGHTEDRVDAQGMFEYKERALAFTTAIATAARAGGTDCDDAKKHRRLFSGYYFADDHQFTLLILDWHILTRPDRFEFLPENACYIVP